MRRQLATLAITAAAMLAVPAASSADTLLVANFSSDNVSVIDTGTNAVVATIPVGHEPIALVITPNGNRAYVANQGSNTVTVINVATRAVIGSPIPVPNVGALAAAPDGRKVYVVSGSFVKAIDTSTNSLVSGGIHDEIYPSGQTGIALTPDQSQVWVGHSTPNTFVTRLPTDGSSGGEPPLTNLGPSAGPKAIAFTPDGSRAYVASETGSGIYPMSVATGAASTPIPAGPDSVHAIAITPDGSRAYVPADGNDSDVFAINLKTNTVIPPTTSLPSGPTHLVTAAITPDGSYAYVAGGVLPDPGQVVGIRIKGTTAVTTPVDVGQTPIAMAFVPEMPPLASLAPVGPGIAGVPVSFNASASSDPDGTVSRYTWSYGDGSPVVNTGARPRHAFAAGSYSVKVTVTDNDGCSVAPLYTGQTAYCGGSTRAAAKRTLVVQGIDVGAVETNDRKGTATIPVHVPSACALKLDGKGLASQTASAGAASDLVLNVKPTGSAKRKLKRKGKLTVHPTITFTATGGSPQSQSLTVKLKRAKHSR